jgi:hypothetical protein
VVAHVYSVDDVTHAQIRRSLSKSMNVSVPKDKMGIWQTYSKQGLVEYRLSETFRSSILLLCGIDQCSVW